MTDRICPRCNRHLLEKGHKACVPCKQAHHEIVRKRQSEIQRARRASEKTPTECPVCGSEFMPSFHNRQLCSDKCREARQEVYRSRQSKRQRASTPKVVNGKTPETGQAQLLSSTWPEGYGIFHWGEIREWAEYGTCPPDAVFVDVNDDTIRFRIQVTQESFDEGACAPQNLVRVV